MTISLPNDLESSIRAEVASGHFASVDDAMAEAARLLLRELKLGHIKTPDLTAYAPADPLLGSIGAMREDAELLDEIVADAYRQRQEEPWREIDL
jgi:Arc/MetJ-type ribon-helix-helix transcriptional regulator